MKDVKDIPKDVYSLFQGGGALQSLSQEHLDNMFSNLTDLLQRALVETEEEENPVIRFSKLGLGDRRIWFDHNKPKEGVEDFSGQQRLSFLFGNIIEELLLYLVKEAGYEVSDEQLELNCEGITGHIDAVIEGRVADAKSISPFVSSKFSSVENLAKDDAFGYISQLFSYSDFMEKKEPFFLTFDKSSAKIGVLELSEDMQREHPKTRVEHLRNVIELEEKDLPPRCHEDIPEGKSGNKTLQFACQVCPHKFECWDLTGYEYANGVKYLTKVVKEPKVKKVYPPKEEEFKEEEWPKWEE